MKRLCGVSPRLEARVAGLLYLISIVLGVALFSIGGCWFPQSWFRSAHVTNLLFFGVYCLLVGYLILRSRFLTNAVGVLMASAGVCWIANSWPALDHVLSPYTMVVGLVGEGTFMAYLLVKGLNEQRWREQANAT